MSSEPRVKKTIKRYRVRLDLDRPLRLGEGDAVSGPASAAGVARLALRGEASEVLIVLAVDSRGRVVSVIEVARGGASSLCAYAPEVLRAVLLSGVNGFVLAHNHPSGDPTPSAEDVHFTKRVNAAADAVGLSLLDHVVVGEPGRGYCPGYVSMLDAGLIEG